MCGINGIVTLDGPNQGDLEKKIKQILSLTAHRGPDQSTSKIFKNAAIGTNRLAIVAPGDRDVLQSDTNQKRFAVLNGEIVNYKELAKSLPNDIRGKSDGAIILPMINKYGKNFIKMFAGMFAIAVYDENKNSLQLWRDPLGIKPLYYYNSGSMVIFSSEIKAIRSVLDKPLQPDFSALSDILKYRFKSGRNTVFPAIKKVLPGETITFSTGQEIHERYWTLKPNDTKTNEQVSITDFRELFTKVISENSDADVPGGFFTSGGLDSSMITARALGLGQTSYSQPISIKFSPNSVIDEKYAEILERFLKVDFEWVEISDDTARQTLTDIIPYMDEPLENPIHIGTYLMAKRARELGIKSVITGDGSDEFFLGYERHANWFRETDPVTNYPKLHYTLMPEDTEELYTKDALGQLRAALDGYGDEVEPIRNMQEALRYERAERLPEYHNMRLDRMTMANGVEARVPFLDHRIVDYSLRIQVKDLFGSNGKDWLKEVAKPWLPSEILNRPKTLFPSLPDQWLSGKGSTWAADILLNPSSNIGEWTRRDTIARYIKEHANNQTKRGKLLWALVVLELWLNNQEILPN